MQRKLRRWIGGSMGAAPSRARYVIRSVLLALVVPIVILSLYTSQPNAVSAEPQTCDRLIYQTSLDEPTEVQTDLQRTCPAGGGPRAFVSTAAVPGDPQPEDHHHDGAAHVPAPAKLKEVRPDPVRRFECVKGSICRIVVRGFGLQPGDALLVLPLGDTECPPEELPSADQTTDLSKGFISVSTEYATLASASSAIDTFFTVFELPEVITQGPENATLSLCYAPVLASRAKRVSDLSPEDFHYFAGKLLLSEAALSCSFEDTPDVPRNYYSSGIAAPDDVGPALSDEMPCGFRNYRQRWDATLLWRLGRGETETPYTGPLGDSTPGYDGKGVYAYMDSPGYALGAVATLVSAPLALEEGTYCVYFRYNMNGIDSSTLRVYLHEVSLATTPLSSDAEKPKRNSMGQWSAPRWVAVGNKGERWHLGGFEFTQGKSGNLVQLVFEALAGASELADIALDDIAMAPGACPAPVRFHMPRSVGKSIDERLVCGEVRLDTGAHAIDKSWYIDGAVSCAGRGYSVDNFNRSSWLPCCVPSFGTYKLVLQDDQGDGWEGSKLLLRFFDRTFEFGADGSFASGFDQTYPLIIGSLEILAVTKPTPTSLTVAVLVSQPNSFLWCGVVKARRDGRVLDADINPNTVKQYGVRSIKSTTVANEVMNVVISRVLGPRAAYDLYCYAEPVDAAAPVEGEPDEPSAPSLPTNSSTNEIRASRVRVTTDNAAPQLEVVAVRPQFDSVEVDLRLDEPAAVWCAAIAVHNASGTAPSIESLLPPPQMPSGDETAALSSAAPALEGWKAERQRERERRRIIAFFEQTGSGFALEAPESASGVQRAGTAAGDSAAITSTVSLQGLVPGFRYTVFCYAEDRAAPTPNFTPLTTVEEQEVTVTTPTRTPKIRIVRRTTLLRGFSLAVRGDAPGFVWCAAAPPDYPVPDVESVVQVGARAQIEHPEREAILELKGVEPSTLYSIYCVGGRQDLASDLADVAVAHSTTPAPEPADGGGTSAEDSPDALVYSKWPSRFSTHEQMLESAVVAMSYGRYCDQESADAADPTAPAIAELKDYSPFHPLRPDEDTAVRDFMLSRHELDLMGLYRVTVLPNKTEAYDFLYKGGPRPPRRARVRAGRCDGDVGFYEQFVVWPLEDPEHLQYRRIAHPVETECGGYNPQGVFGRLLLEEEKTSSDRSRTRDASELRASVSQAAGPSDTCGSASASTEHPVAVEFNSFLVQNFGYGFGTVACNGPDLNEFRRRRLGADLELCSNEAATGGGLDGSPSATHECAQLGPLLVEQLPCDDDDDTDGGSTVRDESDNSSSECSGSSSWEGARAWVGLKSSDGERLPIYFIFNIREPDSSNQESPENAPGTVEWIQRVIQERAILPDKSLDFWNADEIWYDGVGYPTVSRLLEAVKHAPKPIPQGATQTRALGASATAKIRGGERNFESGFDSASEAPVVPPGLEKVRRSRQLQEAELLAEARRRVLAPQPFSGAAGTAGPLPSRQARREGLEYRAAPEHIESQGRRFSIQGSRDQEEYHINYAGWNMTVINDEDTSLRIYNLQFQGIRIAFEVGLMEALAHYTVSERNWFFLDSWYGGLGTAARRVFKGIECPKTGVSLFWSGSLCVFEQDMARPFRSHWRSSTIRDGAPHTTLVLRQMITVSNYDYVTDYRFHPNGVFEGSVSFTGELYAGVEVPWYSARQSDYGTQVTGAMRFAALHSHMAAWKIDLDVGPGDRWMNNSVLLSEVIPDPRRPGANKLKRSYAETERQAAFFRNDSRALIYEVVDEDIKIFGNTGGFRVIPNPGLDPLHHDFELYQGPAAWAKYRLFSTRHKYSELDTTLPRDNKFAKKPAVSIDRYVLDDEPIRGVDVVSWIGDGIFHLPVVEDMPLTIPVGNTLGWMVKPSNMFLEDPSMDLWNSMGGGVEDPGTCAVIRRSIGDVEPTMDEAWKRR